MSGELGARRLPLLEALFAVHRAPLRRLEGNRRLLAALRAARRGLDPLAGTVTHSRVPFALALLAPLGLILEILVGVKELFACGPHKLLMALNADQTLVSVLHDLS
jgi:hypothetical protein